MGGITSSAEYRVPSGGHIANTGGVIHADVLIPGDPAWLNPIRVARTDDHIYALGGPVGGFTSSVEYFDPAMQPIPLPGDDIESFVYLGHWYDHAMLAGAGFTGSPTVGGFFCDWAYGSAYVGPAGAGEATVVAGPEPYFTWDKERAKVAPVLIIGSPSITVLSATESPGSMVMLGDATSGLRPGGDARPYGFKLFQNAPNPFRHATSIRYLMARKGHVELNMYNIRGHLVRSLVKGEKPTGVHEVSWDGKDDNGKSVASGIYLFRLEASVGVELTRKMVLLK